MYMLPFMKDDLRLVDGLVGQMPCLCGVLLVAARAVARMYNDELRMVGLEVTQHAMLAVLKGLGPMAVGELGHRLAVDKTTMSRNVKVLQRQGWVALQRGRDGRERIAEVTPAGVEMLRRARPHWERAQARMKSSLADGGFDVIKRELHGLAMAGLRA